MIRLLLGLGLVGCSDDGGPRLISAEPPAAGPGARVTLAGEHLCGQSSNCETAAGEIQIGLSPPTVLARVIDYTDTSAVIEIPTIVEVGPSAILVIVNEQSSNALDFEVTPPP